MVGKLLTVPAVLAAAVALGTALPASAHDRHGGVSVSATVAAPGAAFSVALGNAAYGYTAPGYGYAGAPYPPQPYGYPPPGYGYDNGPYENGYGPYDGYAQYGDSCGRNAYGSQVVVQPVIVAPPAYYGPRAYGYDRVYRGNDRGWHGRGWDNRRNDRRWDDRGHGRGRDHRGRWDD